MHRDKTVARILLILSVVHVAVAAPLITERSQGLNEDVTPTSENGINLVGDSPQDLSSVPHMNNEPPTSGTPPSQDHSLPESGTPQLYHDQSLASGPPPSQDATSPASGDSQSHSGPPAGSNDPQLHNTDLSPTGDMVLAKSSAPPPPPKANGLFTDAMKKKLKVVAGFGVLAGFTGGLIYGAHKLIKDPSQEVYVSVFFPPSPADIQLSHNVLTYDLPQPTRWQGSYK